MLKFESEIADNFKRIYSLGSEIQNTILGNDVSDSEKADKVLKLYQERKPYFENISLLISEDRKNEGKIGSNLNKWQDEMKPLLKQDKYLNDLLSTFLNDTKKKLIDSSKGRSLIVYTKGDKK